MIFVGFSRPNKFKIFSFLIRLFLRTPYSHVYIRFYDAYTAKWIIFEASHGEVHLMEWNNWMIDNNAIEERVFELDELHRREVIRFAIDHLQKPYSLANILGIVFYGIFKKRIFQDGPKAFICSELIALALDNKVSFKKPLDLVTPKDIHKAVFGVYNVK